MIRLSVAILVAAAPVAAQVPPLSFENGKSQSIAPGQWTYVPTATGSEARYGAIFSLRCERAARIVTVARMDSPSASLTIATSELTRALPVGGRLLASDPLLDAIAFSRGRLLVSAGSSSVLAIPSWPEAARAIEDCRN